ncbi:hypothetical protein CSQ96_19665 [Janthinobacterium sp. BJB412]|nr:hypothetical protein CSQ96_19665 [Janthinobacterium sp. BJB412]
MLDDDRVKNRWVVWDSLEFYVRKGHITNRQHEASIIKPCLMVANFHVLKGRMAESKRLTTQMIDFMNEVEANAVQFGYAGVFVECVFNPKLRPLLTRFGYRQLHLANYSAPCYFKSTMSIMSTTRHATYTIQKLQRPSLRRFLQTPSINQFWLREQNENVMMLVRRDRIGSSPIASHIRLTILDLYLYKVSDDSSHSDHSFYWSDHKTLFIVLLRKLESRLLTGGFHELAISPLAIRTWVRTEQGGRTNAGEDLDAARNHMRQLGYFASSSPNDRQMYVKSLNLAKDQLEAPRWESRRNC